MAQAGESSMTFSLAEEDHTLGNSVRYMLNQDPRVTLCGYSVPHPSDNCVNVRVQTTGDPAREVFRDALISLSELCSHVSQVFEAEFAKFQAGAAAGAAGAGGAAMDVEEEEDESDEGEEVEVEEEEEEEYVDMDD